MRSQIEERITQRPPWTKDEAYLAGLIATDGWVEHRKGRLHPTAVAVKQGPKGAPLIRELGKRFDRSVYERSGDDRVLLTFVDKPVCWKTEVPDLEPHFIREYLRGLLDGDGCLSGAKKHGKFYPYISFCFNPKQEAWLGDWYCDLMQRLGIEYRVQTQPRKGWGGGGIADGDEEPTVKQIRTWGLQARELAALVYTGADLAHPHKLDIAKR